MSYGSGTQTILYHWRPNPLSPWQVLHILFLVFPLANVVSMPWFCSVLILGENPHHWQNVWVRCPSLGSHLFKVIINRCNTLEVILPSQFFASYCDSELFQVKSLYLFFLKWFASFYFMWMVTFFLLVYQCTTCNQCSWRLGRVSDLP